MAKRVNPPLFLLVLLAAVLPSCGPSGQVDIVTQPDKRGPLEVTTAGLPTGAIGQPYKAQLTASGGVRPYTWSVPFGELPPGLSLNPTSGAVTGTPTRVENYSFTVRVADSTLLQQQTAMAILDASIAAPPVVITTDGVPDGITGQAYAAQFAATGGTPPYVWSVVEGLLAPDLTLDSATGILSGIPSLEGNYSFTIQVTDSATPAATARLAVRPRSPR